MKRRGFILMSGAALLSGLLLPLRALAAVWNKAAFEATTLAGATQGLQVGKETPSADITVNAPDRAENGAVVQVEVISRIPGTEAIAIVVEHNPTPLIANFMFAKGADPYVVTRIKMAETAEVKAIVKVGSRYFTAGKQVEVLENGCG